MMWAFTIIVIRGGLNLMIKNGWVIHLLQYSLKELRRRQDITNQQIEIAHEMGKDKALAELQNMADSLIEAIYLKTDLN